MVPGRGPPHHPWPYDPAAAGAARAAGWLPARWDPAQRRRGNLDRRPREAVNIQAEFRCSTSCARSGSIDDQELSDELLFARTAHLWGTYDLSLTMDTNGPDPDNEGSWSGAFLPPKGVNTTFLADPVLTATSHEAAHTLDRTRRKALYQRQAERIHELVPAIFLYWQVAYAAYNSDLKNYKPAQYISSNWNSWEWEL